MNHSLAQVFRGGLPPRLTKRAMVSRAVIVKNKWMIHGDIRRTLLKVAHRIATRRHHVAQQLICVRYCTSGTVNEPRLDSGPGLDEPCTIGWSKRPDVQSLHAFCAPVEHRFCLPPAPAFLHGPGIFRATKLRA